VGRYAHGHGTGTVGNHQLPTTTECRYSALQPQTSTPYNSTTTTAMDAAIEAMEREGEGEEIGYVVVAKKYGVDESTLRRRQQGKCTTRAEAAQMRQKLNPKQEKELCKYINTLTGRALPPTRMMVASFASQICKKEVGVNWVSRFLKRHQGREHWECNVLYSK
jgi:hypothetical protein